MPTLLWTVQCNKKYTNPTYGYCFLKFSQIFLLALPDLATTPAIQARDKMRSNFAHTYPHPAICWDMSPTTLVQESICQEDI